MRVHVTRCSFGNEFTQKVWGVHTRNLGALALVLFVFVAIGRRGPTLNATERTSAGFGRLRTSKA